MSAVRKESIPVRVTIGEPYIARASTGVFSTTASSTSSSRQAALAAAAKFFEAQESEIELSQTEQGSRTDRRPDFFLAWPKRFQLEGGGSITITRIAKGLLRNSKPKTGRAA